MSDTPTRQLVADVEAGQRAQDRLGELSDAYYATRKIK